MRCLKTEKSQNWGKSTLAVFYSHGLICKLCHQSRETDLQPPQLIIMTSKAKARCTGFPHTFFSTRFIVHKKYSQSNQVGLCYKSWIQLTYHQWRHFILWKCFSFTVSCASPNFHCYHCAVIHCVNAKHFCNNTSKSKIVKQQKKIVMSWSIKLGTNKSITTLNSFTHYHPLSIGNRYTLKLKKKN